MLVLLGPAASSPPRSGDMCPLRVSTATPRVPETRSNFPFEPLPHIWLPTWDISGGGQQAG